MLTSSQPSAEVVLAYYDRLRSQDISIPVATQHAVQRFGITSAHLSRLLAGREYLTPVLSTASTPSTAFSV